MLGDQPGGFGGGGGRLGAGGKTKVLMSDL